MGTATAESQQATYTAVPLAGLVAKEPTPFPLYLRTSDNTWVLYRPAAAARMKSRREALPGSCSCMEFSFGIASSRSSDRVISWGCPGRWPGTS